MSVGVGVDVGAVVWVGVGVTGCHRIAGNHSAAVGWIVGGGGAVGVEVGVGKVEIGESKIGVQIVGGMG